MALPVVTPENYYSPEMNMAYMGSTQFKAFERCEAAALAELKGEYRPPSSAALLVGGYIDAWFSGELPLYQAQHPEIFKRDGTLKAEYVKATEVVARLQADDLYSLLMSGKKQVIRTGTIAGVPFKIKIDSLLDADILTYINETYGGLSDKLATSYDALTDNLSDVQADIDSAMGEGYNEERSKSIAAQIESYGGELGDALQEANKAIGAGRAALENLADQYTEEALSAVLTGKETALDWSDGNAERLQELAGLYQQAMEDYNNGNTQAGTLVETYLEEARALAEAQYDSSEAVRAQTDAENDMITAIRENTAALGGWKAQYDLSQNLTKGRAATWTATTQTTGTSSGTNTMIANGYGYANVVPRNAIGYAVGIDYVPYDNFPALLHQGEQVLTAEEARSGNGGSGGVQIIMNGVTIREDADIDRVAAALLQKMELAGMRG